MCTSYKVDFYSIKKVSMHETSIPYLILCFDFYRGKVMRTFYLNVLLLGDKVVHRSKRNYLIFHKYCPNKDAYMWPLLVYLYSNQVFRIAHWCYNIQNISLYDIVFNTIILFLLLSSFIQRSYTIVQILICFYRFVIFR